MADQSTITKIIYNNKILHWFIVQINFLCFRIIRFFSKSITLSRETVVIISLHKLGDSVFTFHAVKKILKHYPESYRIICFRNMIPIYKLIAEESRIIGMDKDHFLLNDRIATRKAKKILAELHPEIIFDLTGVMTSASLIYNSRAKIIAGMNRDFFKGIYDYYSPIRTKPHSKDIYLDAIKTYLSIYEPKDEYKLLSENNRGSEIKIHPFAGWKSKEWNLNKFIRLAENLNEDNPTKLLLPPDSLPEDILEYLDNRKINYVFTKDVDELIKEISTAFILIGNDSGAVQIASALGIPTFSIYGPTNPVFHIPEGKLHKYFQKKLKCSPEIDEKLCFTDGGKKGCYSFECMNQISIDEILFEVRKFLREVNSKV